MIKQEVTLPNTGTTHREWRLTRRPRLNHITHTPDDFYIFAVLTRLHGVRCRCTDFGKVAKRVWKIEKKKRKVPGYVLGVSEGLSYVIRDCILSTQSCAYSCLRRGARAWPARTLFKDYFTRTSTIFPNEDLVNVDEVEAARPRIEYYIVQTQKCFRTFQRNGH
ncbi:hypothetical protein EVAR_5991_1 [Eumeta japonica]|uniref:Uncharacterized protein n=1 Tax=Eumeta variegata TaxID=151549 RepID=A0A4C1TAH7_EUMVA|nr:hypothetical protein EVAR_5991_1 [Eumeta japonica]